MRVEALAQEDAQTTATYDGSWDPLKLDGEVLSLEDERRRLVSRILFRLPAGINVIYESAFFDCTSLSSVNLPERLTTLGPFAFLNCTSLSSILLPSALTTIEEQAFRGCTSLTSVTLPTGLKTIGGGAFYGCTSLSSILLPEGLTTIGGNAFVGCTILELRSRAAGHPSVEAYLRFETSS